jgi:hypothetical protein
MSVFMVRVSIPAREATIYIPADSEEHARATALQSIPYVPALIVGEPDMMIEKIANTPPLAIQMQPSPQEESIGVSQQLPTMEQIKETINNNRPTANDIITAMRRTDYTLVKGLINQYLGPKPDPEQIRGLKGGITRAANRIGYKVSPDTLAKLMPHIFR